MGASILPVAEDSAIACCQHSYALIFLETSFKMRRLILEVWSLQICGWLCQGIVSAACGTLSEGAVLREEEASLLLIVDMNKTVWFSEAGSRAGVV